MPLFIANTYLTDVNLIFTPDVDGCIFVQPGSRTGEHMKICQGP